MPYLRMLYRDQDFQKLFRICNIQWFYLNIEIENSSREDINDRLREIREAKSKKSNLLETYNVFHPTIRVPSYLKYFKTERDDDDIIIGTKD